MAGKALLFLLAFMLFVSTLHAHTYAPVPKRGPAYPPAHEEVSPTHPHPGHRNHGDCVAKCVRFCNPHHSKRMCSRACVPCCDVRQCVPGLGKSCDNWTQVEYYGKTVKCPEILLSPPITQPPM